MKFLYHHRIASKDGQYVHIEEMINALRALGHEVTLTGPAIASKFDFGGQSRLVDRLKQRLPKALYEILEVAYNLVAYFRLARSYRATKPTVIYERYNLFLLAGAIHRQLRGGRLLVEINAPLTQERLEHDGLALPWLARWCDRFVWHHADHIFTVTEVLAGYIQAAGVPSERITITPNGIDLERFDQAPSNPEAKARLGLTGKRVIGFTGFVREWHGLERIVDWLAHTPHHDTVLLIVGDGPARISIEARAEKLGIIHRLHLTGVVDRDAIPAHVAAFDIALQPAVVPYASPLKLFEYMALSRPIIAPDTPNIREILTDGHDALLVAKGDESNAIANALDYLLTHQNLAQQLGHQARKTLLNRDLTWTGNAKRVEFACRDLSLG